MSDKKPTLGFIGIGLMGKPMTLRLLNAGFSVNVWNRNPEKLTPVTNAGAKACASIAELVTISDVIILCLADTAVVESVIRNDILENGSADKLLIDLSSIHPENTRQLAAMLQEKCGMGWVDAPVSGGPEAARDGTLAVMAGGAAADVAAIQAVMADVAANFTHIGPSGAGQTAKLINQAIVGTGYVLMAEALILAEAAGIDAAKLPQCLAGGHADSNLLRKLYPRMQARDFDPPRSYARQLLKDMKAVTAFAHALGLELPVVEAAAERYLAYASQGNELKDSASIVRLYERKP